MTDQFTPITSMPAFWAIVIALIVVGGILYGLLTWRTRTAQIIGGLALRASQRPKDSDWSRLMAAAEREGCLDTLLKQIEDIDGRFGENTIRCGHLAVFWYMVLGQTPWTLQLPSFADKNSFDVWQRG